MGTRHLGQVGAEGRTGHPCQTLQILAMTQPAPSSHCRTLSPSPDAGWREAHPCEAGSVLSSGRPAQPEMRGLCYARSWEG